MIATEAGHELGRHLARLCDAAEPLARDFGLDMEPRCASCPFRAGPHVPNGSPRTLMDAIRKTRTGEALECNEPERAEEGCTGWAIFLFAEVANDVLVEAGMYPEPLSLPAWPVHAAIRAQAKWHDRG